MFYSNAESMSKFETSCTQPHKQYQVHKVLPRHRPLREEGGDEGKVLEGFISVVTRWFVWGLRKTMGCPFAACINHHNVDCTYECSSLSACL